MYQTSNTNQTILPFHITLHNNAAVHRMSGAPESSFRVLVRNTTVVARVRSGGVQREVVILLPGATRAFVALFLILLLMVVLMGTSIYLRA